MEANLGFDQNNMWQVQAIEKTQLPGINRVVVFSSTHRAPRRLLAEWAAYFVASLGGGCLNYLVFVIAVRVSPLLHHIPSIAVALGSLAGTTFNFLMYARYVFRTHAPPAPRVESDG